MRNAVFRGLSRLLARLPLERAGRERIKATVYTRFGTWFAASPNYQLWRRAHPEGRPRPAWPPLRSPSISEWEALPRSTDPAGEPYVLVPVFRGETETLACLHAARRTAPRARLVVVDDASPEPRLSAALLALAEAGHFELIRNATNRGFLRSVERGMLFDPTADVVLLNADVVVFGDWLDRLRAAAGTDPHLGTLTPLSNHGDIASYPHPNAEQRARLEVDLETLDHFAAHVNGGCIVQAPSGVGFCLYVKRVCYEAVGGFDHAFAAGYGEESDFSCRAAEKGWHHGIAADVLVRHEGARSFGGRAPRLRRRAAATLAERHPAFEGLVDDFVARDPVSAARARIDAARLRARAGEDAKGEARAVLLVSHDWGGGVEAVVQERTAAYLGAGHPVYVLRARSGAQTPTFRLENSGELEALEDAGALADVHVDALPSLVDALRILRVACAEVHHVGAAGAGGAAMLVSLFGALDVPFRVALHDYGFDCPRLHLEDEAGRYCGEPDVSGCRRCLAERGHRFSTTEPALDLMDWRKMGRGLLLAADEVVCFTREAAARVRDRVPDARVVIESPFEPVPATTARVRRDAAGKDGLLRVLVPGAINDQKGFRVLLATAAEARRRRLPIRFEVVGYSRDDAALRAEGVTVRGRFAPEDADQVLAEAARAPCVVWLPSVAPETWGRVLTSTWRLGLHPVAFDLGALGERIRDAGRGTLWPLAWADDVTRLLEAFLAIKETEPMAPSLGDPPTEPPIPASLRTALARPPMGRLVFLDRDGVLGRDSPHYVRSLADWRPIPGSLEAIARLTRAGHRVAVVTNQSGIARGLLDERAVDAIHAKLRAQVAALGGRIDGVFFCPHHPDAGCSCRKPGTALLEEALRSLDAPAEGALFVGDKRSDALAAIAFGARAVLVETGQPLPPADDPIWAHAERAPDLATAISIWLGPSGGGALPQPASSLGST